MIQEAEPVLVLYVDMAQASQVPPSSPMYPASHTHTFVTCAKRVWAELAEQVTQDAEPVLVL